MDEKILFCILFLVLEFIFVVIALLKILYIKVRYVEAINIYSQVYFTCQLKRYVCIF